MLSRAISPKKQGAGLVSEMDDYEASMRESDARSIQFGDIRSIQPKSPHKIARGHKLRVYEKSKQSITISNMNNEELQDEIERNFSPIDTHKGFGVRFGIAKRGKNIKSGLLHSNTQGSNKNASPLMKSQGVNFHLETNYADQFH